MRPLAIFLVAFAVGFFGLGCSPSTLERHIRSADDFRAVNASVVEQIRERCPAEDASEGCVHVREVQHHFVDTHTQWVQELQSDRAADRWDAPEDGGIVRLVAMAYNQLVSDAATWLGLTLPEVPASFRKLLEAP